MSTSPPRLTLPNDSFSIESLLSCRRPESQPHPQVVPSQVLSPLPPSPTTTTTFLPPPPPPAPQGTLPQGPPPLPVLLPGLRHDLQGRPTKLPELCRRTTSPQPSDLTPASLYFASLRASSEPPPPPSKRLPQPPRVEGDISSSRDGVEEEVEAEEGDLDDQEMRECDPGVEDEVEDDDDEDVVVDDGGSSHSTEGDVGVSASSPSEPQQSDTGEERRPKAILRFLFFVFIQSSSSFIIRCFHSSFTSLFILSLLSFPALSLLNLRVRLIMINIILLLS